MKFFEHERQRGLGCLARLLQLNHNVRLSTLHTYLSGSSLFLTEADRSSSKKRLVCRLHPSQFFPLSQSMMPHLSGSFYPAHVEKLKLKDLTFQLVL